MILVLLIALPLVIALLTLATSTQVAKALALLGSVGSLVLATIAAAHSACGLEDSFISSWIPMLGAQFSLRADGMSAMLALLTGLVFTILFIAEWNKTTTRNARYYALMMLTQCGLYGVFLSSDLLLFYLFWETTLIPAYFLCSNWGGEKRIAATFKFFIYTVFGSLLMLAGIIFLSVQNYGVASFSWANIAHAGSLLPADQQQWLFCLLFLAFAIKMPLFPFHTWQPDTYEQVDTPITIVLSALMVKMGLFATLRWLLPVLPQGAAFWSDIIITLAIIGILYASCLAMVQDNLKRLVAYSSIAHMGLMCAGIFAQSQPAMHGVMVQMFNHGINVTALWLIVSMIENRYGTVKMSDLGGMAGKAPWMAVGLVVVAFASIGLPLTNGFIGEFLLFHGLFQSPSPYHIWYMVLAGLAIILGAVYTLGLLQKVAFGSQKTEMRTGGDLTTNECIAIAVLILLIIVLGVYPKPLLDLTATVV